MNNSAQVPEDRGRPATKETMNQLKNTLTAITLFCLLMIPAALCAKKEKDNEHYRREHPERFCPACGQLLPTGRSAYFKKETP